MTVRGCFFCGSGVVNCDCCRVHHSETDGVRIYSHVCPACDGDNVVIEVYPVDGESEAAFRHRRKTVKRTHAGHGSVVAALTAS